MNLKSVYTVAPQACFVKVKEDEIAVPMWAWACPALLRLPLVARCTFSSKIAYFQNPAAATSSWTS